MNVLEVIALNINDVKELNKTNVDRIELCVNIEKDGLTPSKELIVQALEVSNKNIAVMLRDSDTFILTDQDFAEHIQMLKWLASIKKEFSNLVAIVTGYIYEDETLNENYLNTICKYKDEIGVTFHKACDSLIDNNEVYKLKNFNITTILTQGGKDSITNNVDQIRELQTKLPEIEILLGGGINEKNIDELIKLSTSIHLGSFARNDKDFNQSYNIDLLNEIKAKMLKQEE